MRFCEWCNRPFTRPHRRGPSPRFCSNAHRQAAHRVRAKGRQDANVIDEVTRFGYLSDSEIAFVVRADTSGGPRNGHSIISTANVNELRRELTATIGGMRIDTAHGTIRVLSVTVTDERTR